MIAEWIPGILKRAATIGLRLTVSDGVLSYQVPTVLVGTTAVTELLWDIGQVKEDVIEALTQAGAP